MNEFLKYEVLKQSQDKGKDDEVSNGGQERSDSPQIDVGAELDRLFPPKIVTEEGEVKTIRASREQANLFEIYKLGDDLDDMVNNLESEQTGFSSKLGAIYDQLFDELIRQEMIACPERGLMLVAVRDEASRTLESMQRLYRSCFAYAVTKDLLTRRDIVQKRKDIPKFVEQINGAKETLQNMRDAWQQRRRKEEEEERIRIIRQTFVENQLVITNQQMVNQIEDLIDTEHKWLKDLD